MSTDELPVTTVELPEGATSSINGRTLTIKGPQGKFTKVYERVHVDLQIRGNTIQIRPFTRKKKDVVSSNTMASIVRNIAYGVTKGFTYKMKIVFAHFPVTVKVKGDQVQIENFVGERAPRVAKIVGACKVSVEGDDIIIKGVSLEDVGQTAANIEQATKIKRKDQRIFLDGIYVYEKIRG